MRKQESSLLHLRQTAGQTEARVLELHALVGERKRELAAMRLTNFSSFSIKDSDSSAESPSATKLNRTSRVDNGDDCSSDSDSDSSSNFAVSNLERARQRARDTVGKLLNPRLSS
jgi:hypothetical protein